MVSFVEQSFEGMVGACPEMQRVLACIPRVAHLSLPLLISGEPGVGKGRLARAIHAAGPRAEEPFVRVDCTTLGEDAARTLMGSVMANGSGATIQEGFVGRAAGGTLFLAEVDALSTQLQGLLLDLITQGEYLPVGLSQRQPSRARVIVSSCQDLRTLVRQKEFRLALYYLVSVVNLVLPPLRARAGDVATLASWFLERCCRRYGRDALPLPPTIEKALQRYSWPGNLHELEQLIERAVVLSQDQGELEALMLAACGGSVEERNAGGMELPDGVWADFPEPQEDLSLEEYFQRYLLEHQHHMSETELAQKLGISRKCLWERRQRLGLPRTSAKSSGARTKSPPAASKPRSHGKVVASSG